MQFPDARQAGAFDGVAAPDAAVLHKHHAKAGHRADCGVPLGERFRQDVDRKKLGAKPVHCAVCFPDGPPAAD